VLINFSAVDKLFTTQPPLSSTDVVELVQQAWVAASAHTSVHVIFVVQSQLHCNHHCRE
jgi:hypothetical protein